MHGSNTNLRRRRLIASAITLAAIAICWLFLTLETQRLGNPAMMSGSIVFACLLILLALGIRRRLPFWPLGNFSAWTQVHLYVGIFTSVVYVMHVPQLVAGGLFEFVLSCLFIGVAASGFYGLNASRTLPKRLSAIEGEIRFDRVGWHREQIALAAGKTLSNLSESEAARVLSVFYSHALKPFFGKQPSIAYVVAPTSSRRRQLLSDLRELDRYLETDGRRAAGQFAALIRRRDDLDYQYALQLRLRVWVVFHAVLSLVLLAASIVHVAVVLRFVQ